MCRPSKSLAKLAEGKHVFYVDGTNKGGVDPKIARFKFTI